MAAAINPFILFWPGWAWRAEIACRVDATMGSGVGAGCHAGVCDLDDVAVRLLSCRCDAGAGA